MPDAASVHLLDAKHAGGYRVWLRFADGLEGEIDLTDELWGPVFEPLKDEAAFAKLRFDAELRTVVWPNGADFAPEFLRMRLLAATASTPARSQATSERVFRTSVGQPLSTRMQTCEVIK
ncbi:MAG: DUF2442 domain-containing protein [Dichotomicrobium sp.]